jgi:hypothetical protein
MCNVFYTDSTNDAIITPVTRKWICHLTALAWGLQDWGGWLRDDQPSSQRDTKPKLSCIIRTPRGAYMDILFNQGFHAYPIEANELISLVDVHKCFLYMN